jgi:hypothetical protein
MKNTFVIFLTLVCTVLVSCSHIPTTAGGTDTETGGGTMVGQVLSPHSTPFRGAVVMLVPGGYNPFVSEPLEKANIDTTDSNGIYRFDSIQPGMYAVEAVASTEKFCAMISGIKVESRDSIAVPEAKLQSSASIELPLPANIDTVNGYVYIPGTTYGVPTKKRSHHILMDMLPAGLLHSIFYAEKDTQSSAIMLSDAVKIDPGQIIIVTGNPWQYSQSIAFNTTATGAAVTSDVCHFPVLIRLNTGDFNFSQAQLNGEDIRFAKSDNSPLQYEIERWDPVAGKAEIWVSIDTMYGNSNAHSIIMYWGNSSVRDKSSSGSVFDTAFGFQGVWHLAEPGIAPAYDATWNLYQGTPHKMTSVLNVDGAIGIGRLFSGDSCGLQMVGTANSKLNFPQYGTYSLSAWVKVDSFLEYDQHIVGKGNFLYSMRCKGLSSIPSEYFSFEEYIQDKPERWDRRLYSATIAAWKYLTAVRKGTNAYLYIDGECVDSVGSFFYDNYGNVRDTTTDVSLGRCFKGEILQFGGIMDEVRMSSTANTAAWVKLCYMNQQYVDKLLQFK